MTLSLLQHPINGQFFPNPITEESPTIRPEPRSPISPFLANFLFADNRGLIARSTTSLSLHYHVKPGQKEEALVEMKGMLEL